MHRHKSHLKLGGLPEGLAVHTPVCVCLLYKVDNPEPSQANIQKAQVTIIQKAWRKVEKNSIARSCHIVKKKKEKKRKRNLEAPNYTVHSHSDQTCTF